MGVTYDEYWYGDCSRFHFYEEVYQLKQKEKNFDSWLMGRYVYEAIADISPILHDFVPKGTQAIPYPAEPFPLTEEDQKALEEREKRRKTEKTKAKIQAWAAGVNAHFAKGGGNDGGV